MLTNFIRCLLCFEIIMFVVGCTNNTETSIDKIHINMGDDAKYPEYMYEEREPSDLPKQPLDLTSIHIGVSTTYQGAYRPYLFISKENSYLYDNGMIDTLNIAISEDKWREWYSIFVKYAFDKMKDPELYAMNRCPCSDFIRLTLADSTYSLSKPLETYYQGVYRRFEKELCSKKDELAKPYTFSYIVVVDSMIYRMMDLDSYKFGAYRFPRGNNNLTKGVEVELLKGTHVFSIDSGSSEVPEYSCNILLDGKKDTIYLELDKHNNLVYKLL